MSLIKQKNIKTVTTTSSVSFSDMGEVVLNSATPITITTPLVTGARGLWYRFINIGSVSHVINTSTSTLITNVESSSSVLVISDGTDWIVAGSSSGGGSGDMLKSIYDTDNDGKVNSAVVADSANSVTWTNVSSKPSTFPPDTHNHDLLYDPINSTSTHEGKSVIDVNGIHGFKLSSTPLDNQFLKWSETLGKHIYDVPSGSGLGDMLKATYDTDNNGKVDVADSADSVEWTGIQNKPSTYPPDTHNHDLLYDPINSTSNHISNLVTDMDGIHGFKLASTPVDQQFIKWDNASGKHVYSEAGSFSGFDDVYLTTSSNLLSIDTNKVHYAVSATNTSLTLPSGQDKMLYPIVSRGGGNTVVQGFGSGIDSYTKLMLHMDGANNSTTFADSSINPLTTTVYGDAKISTTQSKFGGASAFFDGTGDSVRVTNNGSLDFGVNDYTVDFWVYFPTSVASSKLLIDWRQSSLANETRPAIYINSSTKFAFYYNGDRCVGTTTPSANTWYHVAVVRNGGTTKLYVNGIQEGGSYTDTNNYSTASYVYIGSAWSGTPLFVCNAYMDEIRVSTIARWIANFTPQTIEYSQLQLIEDLANLTIYNNQSVTLHWDSTNLQWRKIFQQKDTYLASAIINTPSGTITATDIQTAINQLDTKTAKTTYIADWDATATYAIDDSCYYSGKFYKALASNINKQPDIQTSDWSNIKPTSTEIVFSDSNFTSTNVSSALIELFTNVSDGKVLIATAITDKGATASGSDTFLQLATAISTISTGETFSPGVYGSVGTPLIVISSFDLSSFNGVASGISTIVLSELTTDLEELPTLDMNLLNFSSASSSISEPTITIQLL